MKSRILLGMEFKPGAMNVLHEYLNAYNILSALCMRGIVLLFQKALEICSYSNSKFVSLVNTSLGS